MLYGKFAADVCRYPVVVEYAVDGRAEGFKPDALVFCVVLNLCKLRFFFQCRIQYECVDGSAFFRLVRNGIAKAKHIYLGLVHAEYIKAVEEAARESNGVVTRIRNNIHTPIVPASPYT